jgi:hypothetical protein
LPSLPSLPATACAHDLRLRLEASQPAFVSACEEITVYDTKSPTSSHRSRC